MGTNNDGTVRDEVVRIANLAVAHGVVSDRRFENCLILGPAIVVMLDGGTIEDCTFDAPPDELLWDMPMGERRMGAVGLVRSEFIGCRFQNVGFAGTEDFRKLFVAGVTEAQP